MEDQEPDNHNKNSLRRSSNSHISMSDTESTTSQVESFHSPLRYDSPLRSDDPTFDEKNSKAIVSVDKYYSPLPSPGKPSLPATPPATGGKGWRPWPHSEKPTSEKHDIPASGKKTRRQWDKPKPEIKDFPAAKKKVRLQSPPPEKFDPKNLDFPVDGGNFRQGPVLENHDFPAAGGKSRDGPTSENLDFPAAGGKFREGMVPESLDFQSNGGRGAVPESLDFPVKGGRGPAAMGVNRYVREEQPARMAKVGGDGGGGERYVGGGDVEEGVGGERRSRAAVASILNRSKRQDSVKRAGLFFRVFEVIVCLISFSVMAADKTQGWSGDSFDRYKEYRYCLAVNILGFVYAAYQACNLSYHLATGKHVISHRLHYHFDFFMDQILAYLLMSASSSAATRVVDWISNWGKDEFTLMASASIAMSFLAFLTFAMSALISGYSLCNRESA